MFSALTMAVLTAGVAASMLFNGDFEKDLEGWATNHGWYERPAGDGLSEATAAEGEGHDGGKALKIIGGGKRGIVMQNKPVFPGRYRVSGWLKCEDLQPGQAGVLVECMDGSKKWMSGDWAAEVKGTRDWQRFEAVVEAPDGARSVHFDLITTECNEGTVWFDDLEFARLPSGFPEPRPPTLSAVTPHGEQGCLELSWDPKALAKGTMRLIVYAEPEPIADRSGLTPRAILDSDSTGALLRSLEVGRTYHIAAAAVNADGDASGIGPSTPATVHDRRPPRPGWLEARKSAEGDGLSISWSPHILDADIKTIRFVAPGAPPPILHEVDATTILTAARPFYLTQPLVAATVDAPEGATQIGAICEDNAGNRSDPVWVDIQPTRIVPDNAPPCAMWTAPATEQLPTDADPPAQIAAAFDLTLMRGQAKGFQVMVKPGADLHDVRVSFAPLSQDENPAQHIPPQWLAYHFVNYVELEKNSRATPADELLWPAPAEYPDELSDDLSRDLPTARLQPIYIRVTAPRDTLPGVYRGVARVECEEGQSAFEITVRVAPIDLPERPRLKFVYWFSWGDACKEFGVEQYSEEGWQALSRLGQLMRAHHQNTVVVPWSMVRTWRMTDGALAHNFDEFDRFIRTFQEQGVDELFCLSHFGSRKPGGWTCPTMGSHTHRVRRADNGDEERIDCIELLPALERHIEQLGLLDRFAVHVADEPIPVNLDSYRQLSQRVKDAAPRLRRIDAVHVPDLSGALEIWVPQLNYFEECLDDFRAAQQAGNEIWFYVAWVPQGKSPNRMIDGAAIKSRVLHWMNGIYDTSGYLHWALNRWSFSLMSLQSPGDQYICWPSRRFIANSSLRYEAEREGLEDCELMFMLRDTLENGGATRTDAHAAVQRIARQAVPGFKEYTRSWDDLEAARAELMRELIRAHGE